jgi:uroporphyrinogen-III synthase
MATVLLTRPRAASENLADELRRLGYTCVIEPLLAIEPLNTPPPVTPAEICAVMITSANALEAGHGLAAFFDLPCFCVGARTAARARNVGFSHAQGASGDGVLLASFITATLAGSRDSAILHICGQDIDSGVQEELARRGYRVVPWPVYAARPVARLTDLAARLLREGKIDAVTVFSARTAETLKALLQGAALEACCQSLTAIGLSEAVTQALKPLPWKKLAAASSPTEEAVIECLKQMHPLGRRAS